jgi:hypothetical protein
LIWDISDDFEVSIFLTDVSTRHSLLTKQKAFGEPGRAALHSSPSADSPVIIREESIEPDTFEGTAAAPSPQVFETADIDDREVSRSQSEQNCSQRKGKRDLEDPKLTESFAESSSSSSSDAPAPQIPLQKRRRLNAASAVATKTRGDTADDKKLALHMSYDGFSIYGRILCLVVKRKSSTRARVGPTVASAGQAMMEDWIAATQIQREVDAN